MMAEAPQKNHDSDSDASETEETYTLEELGEMYDSANAVLGGSDPNNCSYSLGYVKRQALYACTTCYGVDATKDAKAGVCLACANKCHENHQLIELYTKRSFRCDCGNKKFQTPCLLQPEKDDNNYGNLYNHNFVGLYCTCERPYPDPDDDDEMIQCIVCEDWYHSRHAFGYHSDRVVMGDGSDIDCEMICEKCTKSCDFLKYYGQLRVQVKIKPEPDSTTEATIVKEQEVSPPVSSESNDRTNELKIEIDGDSRASSSVGTESVQLLGALMETKSESSQETRDSGIAMSESNEATAESMISDVDGSKSTECMLKANKARILPATATSWISGWRSKLCRCEKCMNMYFRLGVGFITDDEDTLFAYEALGQEKEKEEEQQFSNMWSKLDHVAKVEAMIGINEIKEHLREFLQKHSGKVIRRREAEEFAEELNAKRAKRAENNGIPPNSCR